MEERWLNTNNGLAVATTTLPLVRWLVGTLQRIDAPGQDGMEARQQLANSIRLVNARLVR